MLSVRNLSIDYLYGVRAITDASFYVQENEKLAVLAPPGGGKTTLFKCLAGLLKPTAGECSLSGNNIYAIKPNARNIVAIGKNNWFLKHQTVTHALEYPLKLRKIPHDKRKQLVLQAAHDFRILPLLNDLISQLYQDDVIRLAFARASLRNPDLFLIDDVFSTLTNQRSESFFELLPFMKSINAPLVFTTSSPDEAFTLCDQTVIMNFGITHQIGTPTEILSTPQTLFVDKLVHPFNSVQQIDENDSQYFMSCQYVESDSGTTLVVKDVIYNAGTAYAIFDNNIKLRLETLPPKQIYTIAIKSGSQSFYAYSTEKRRT
ncbi:MAG: ATP-binding cassette domain-containing protein [Christensenellaceae bacterium]|jgi:ABC-type sugar transport system ATPase subunit|nr:ATP-binding cassette domain-containing protein [Christensenellaceae bacterium]